MSVSKCLNSDYSASWKTIPNCSNCFEQFSTLQVTRNKPMILSCYHNICEKCLLNARQKKLKCHYCNSEIVIVKNTPFRQNFQLNYYLNGFIFYKEHILKMNITKPSNAIQQFGYSNPINEQSFNLQQYECSECNTEYTKHFCVQCSVPYCLSCFKRLHKNGKAFQKHNLSLLERHDNNNIFNKQKDVKCKLHKQILNKYCQTCKEIICDNCATIGTHVDHSIATIQNENKKHLQQINGLIETVKMARDVNFQSLKDTKYVENKYDDYCTEAIENVTSYFNKLHSILQLTESKILMEFKESITNTVGKFKKTQNTLDNSLKNLDSLIKSLQNMVDERPNNLLSNVIGKTNTILETIPCQVKFENIDERSPFQISKSIEMEENLENCVNVKYDNVDHILKVQVLTYFGDLSIHLNENTENIEIDNISDNGASAQDKLMMSLQIDNEKKVTKKQKKNTATIKQQQQQQQQQQQFTTNSLDNRKHYKKPQKTQIAQSSNSQTINNNTQIVSTKLVYVSHIKSPHEFFVQSELFRLSWDEFHKICKTEGEMSATPDYIENNNIYLIYSNNTWYRGKIVKPMKNVNSYKVFLIDYGTTVQIPKQNIRQISDDLRNRQYEATKCSLIGIKKRNDDDEANILFTDIANNQFLLMIILKEDSTYIVDLIVNDNFPTSICDALIYLDTVDIADIDKNDKELNRNLRIYNGMKKKLIPPIKRSFYKTVLPESVHNRIAALNIKDPHEFYVTQYDFKSEIEQISDDLNQTYYKNNKKIFTPRPNMPCAVCLKGKWSRGRILEVELKLKCKVWLVDYGILEIVSWKQLRILDEKFLKNNEYSFQCSLIDIQPLQSNNYSWSSDAITEFKRFMKQSNLQVVVHKTKDFCHKVTLFIAKKTVDINVNALMVKYGFAKSTGLESEFVENPKLNYQNNELLSNLSPIKNNNTELITKNVQNVDTSDEKSINQLPNTTQKSSIQNGRTKICVTSIISPGEFYINLEKHLKAINNLQKEIQIKQNKKISDDPESTIKHNWEINESCFVYTKLPNDHNDNKLQWYRGIITNIDHVNEKYMIFLRDYGLKIDNIKIDKITPIDPILDRICNSAIKCHLACVQPTGGMTNWSHSSIDLLKELIGKYTLISASKQGERKNDSVPIILWGMTNEYIDALSPNFYQWININKILVNNGLAHLYEKFDKGQQDLKYLDKEFAEAEHEIKKLWVNVADDISKVVENHNVVSAPGNKIIDDSMYVDFSDDSDDIENFVSWLPAKPIEKSIFTAIPTYIDDDGYIYLHDARSECIFEKLKKGINQKFENKMYLSKKFNWYIGQPCLARYHLDNLYYRGEIISIKDNTIQVCFIDYGNIEDCNADDLIKDVCLTKIPIQATKYELDGIVPKTTNGKWSRDILDFIHSIIVMKMCSIRISDDSFNNIIKKCTIRCENNNIIDILLENNYAIKKSQVYDKLLQSESNQIFKKSISKNNTIRQFLSDDDDDNLQESSDDENDILKRITKSNTEHYKDSEYYKNLFEKKELENLYTTILSGNNLSDEVIPDLDSFHARHWQEPFEHFEGLTSDNEAEGTLLLSQDDDNSDSDKGIIINDSDDDKAIAVINHQHDNDNENTDDKDLASVISFNPKDTSTVISRFAGLDNFTRSELPYGVQHFYCDIIFMRDATNFFITPLLTEHEKNYLDLTRRIQMYAKRALPIVEITPQMPCLALYKDDNLWYRAIIKTEYPKLDKADVLYVDYLNSDTIPISEIRKCPQQLLKYPMRVMEVRLNRLRPNPRWRNSDILRRLSELLKNRKYYAKVIKSGKIPEIDLFESQNNTQLVLQELINERFYFRESSK